MAGLGVSLLFIDAGAGEYECFVRNVTRRLSFSVQVYTFCRRAAH